MSRFCCWKYIAAGVAGIVQRCWWRGEMLTKETSIPIPGEFLSHPLRHNVSERAREHGPLARTQQWFEWQAFLTRSRRRRRPCGCAFGHSFLSDYDDARTSVHVLPPLHTKYPCTHKVWMFYTYIFVQGVSHQLPWVITSLFLNY